MHTWRTHSAWLLLVLLMLGGVVAPVVHSIQHDEVAHAQVIVPTDADAHLHSEMDHELHADGETSRSHAFQCFLCHTQVVSALTAQVAAPAPPQATSQLDTLSSFIGVVSYLAPSLIRGPPAAA